MVISQLVVRRMLSRSFISGHSASMRQQGAAGIEFALLFLLFFTVFYAIVTYALVFLLRASFFYAAEEGARAAIAIDPLAYPSVTAYNTAVQTSVRNTVGTRLQWLPTKAKTRVLGTGNANVEVTVVNYVVTVRVAYREYNANPLLPTIYIPGYGPIFSMPGNTPDLEGTAILKLV